MEAFKPCRWYLHETKENFKGLSMSFFFKHEENVLESF